MIVQTHHQKSAKDMRWQEYDASLGFPDRLSENFQVLAAVISELKLREVKPNIFAADLAENADNAAFGQTLNHR